MNDLETQSLRDVILEAAKRFPRGISTSMIQATISPIGFKLPEDGGDSLSSHLLYLERAGLLQRQKKAHTASFEVWELTAAGDDYLRSKKLA